MAFQVYDSGMVEAVLLTGGASNRMGTDKARLTYRGEVVSERIARDLASICGKVTVLGREPIADCAFFADEETYAGPLVALSKFTPSAELVFVVSCDLPRFDAQLVILFQNNLGELDAAVPENEGRLQPLCALYRASDWLKIGTTLHAGKKSVMAWVDQLNCRTITPTEIAEAGIDPRAICGANSPEEWERFTSD